MKLGRFIASSTVKHTENNQGNECHICRKSFRTKRGLPQYLNNCRRRKTVNLKASSNNESDENNDNKFQELERQHEDFYWNTVPAGVYQKDLEEANNQIVYWYKNIFRVPTDILLPLLVRFGGN